MADLTALPPLTLTEAEYQGLIVDTARYLGYEVMHVRRSKGRRRGGEAWQTTTSIKGWPDLTIFGDRGLLFVEVKSESGRVTPEQKVVHAQLRAAGQTVIVSKPSTWPDLVTALTTTDVKAKIAAMLRRPTLALESVDVENETREKPTDGPWVEHETTGRRTITLVVKEPRS